MASIPMEYGLLLAGTLFALGLIGVLARRNIVFILMSLEIMLNATGLAFVTAGARWAQADGQGMYLFILSIAAAEVAIGLALVLKLKRQFKTLDADAASRMRALPGDNSKPWTLMRRVGCVVDSLNRDGQEV